jgi:hypothetical protein
METKEQRKRRLELTQARYEEMYREEISKGLIRELKRAANKAPLVSDKIPRLPNK